MKNIFVVILFISLKAGAADQRPAINRTSLQTYFEDTVPSLMEKQQIPGSAVVVVQNTEMIYANGFGVTDVRSRKAVRADQTLFRVGSVTKPFTATAVLQLIEQGKLRLDQNANEYLELPGKAEGPVTVANLLTHTGGFEEKLLRTAVHSRADVLPLHRFLQAEMPRRVLPAGKFICYSNHGFVLIGDIVERISGQRLDQYFRSHIFAPLEMNHTFYGLPPDGTPEMASGYENGKAVERAHLLIGPAAAITTTATDMAHFLIAQLNRGQYRNVRIFSTATSNLMLQRQFTNKPGMIGLSYGFFESNYNNRVSFYHEGGIRGFSSLLYFIPQERIGLFIVNNGYDQSFHWRICDDFLNHFYPAAPQQHQPPTKAKQHAADLEGHYQFLRYSRSTIEKLALLKRSTIQVQATQDGYLNIGGTRFVEVARDLYQQVGSYEHAGFIRDANGKVTHVAVDQDVLERIQWYESATFHQMLVFAFIAAFILLSLPRKRNVPGLSLRNEPESEIVRDTRGAQNVRILSLLNLLFLILLIVMMLLTKPGAIWYGVPRIYYVVLSIPIFSMLLTILLITEVFRTRSSRIGIVILVNVLFFLFLNHWNLLGYRF